MSKHQIPSAKHQAPGKFQIPSSKLQTHPKPQVPNMLRRAPLLLEIGGCNFPGAWSLGLGA